MPLHVVVYIVTVIMCLCMYSSLRAQYYLLVV